MFKIEVHKGLNRIYIKSSEYITEKEVMSVKVTVELKLRQIKPGN